MTLAQTLGVKYEINDADVRTKIHGITTLMQSAEAQAKKLGTALDRALKVPGGGTGGIGGAGASGGSAAAARLQVQQQKVAQQQARAQVEAQKSQTVAIAA